MSIEILKDKSILLPAGEYEAYIQKSAWCNENQGEWVENANGLSIGSRGGRSCIEYSPYLYLRNKQTKGGIILHPVTLGDWSISVQDAKVEITAKAVLCQTFVSGEPYEHTAELHEYLLNEYLKNHADCTPIVYNTWFNNFDDIDVENLKLQLEAAKEIGCEVFVIDAGWYGAGLDWYNHTGDWSESNTRAFYGKMKDFSDLVRKANLGFGLWMEPERFCKGTPIYESHPDWFGEGEGGFYPLLDKPCVYEYVKGEMSRLIETYELAWMKIDFNFNFGKSSEFEWYYILWFQMLDELKAKYPNTHLEGCASGGQRLDIAVLSHFDTHFLTDTVNPLEVLRICSGALLRLPIGYIGSWVVLRNAGAIVRAYDDPYGSKIERTVVPKDATWDHIESVSISYAMKVGMSGTLGFSSDIAGLSDNQKNEVSKWVAYYKQNRKLITKSITYQLTEPKPISDNSGWTSYQLLHKAKSFLFAFRLHDSKATMTFAPKGLDANKMYHLTSPDIDLNLKIKGKELMENGVEVTINKPFEGRIIEING